MEPTRIIYSPIDPFPNLTAWYSGFLTKLFTHPGEIWHSVITGTPFFVFTGFLIAASVFFFVGTIYVIIKTIEVRKKINQTTSTVQIRTDTIKPKRWEVVEKHMHSSNASEWRLAIIEADSLLEEAIRRMGYNGDTLGEMLKKIDISSLNTINEAWEAHKIRNLIAHKGSAYILTAREAKRIIGLYEKVFHELEII